MGPFSIAGCNYEWLFSLGLLLLAAEHVRITNGQQGINLMIYIMGYPSYILRINHLAHAMAVPA